MRRRQTRPVQEHKPPFYVGIDTGKTLHHALVVDATGTAWVPNVVPFANTRPGYTQLFALLAEATAQATPPEITVGCKATGSYWLNLYEALLAQGYRVLVLKPLSVKVRRGTTLRGTKTDPVDARLIAEILQRDHGPASHVPEAAVQGRRDLTRLRADLVAQLGDVKRRIISILDRTFPAFATCFADVCGQAARTRLETWTWPEQLAAVPTTRLAAVLARLSHGYFGAEKARAVKAAAHQSIGVRRAADALAFELRRLVRQIRDLERLVAELDQENGRRHAALDQSLRPIPGLGAATAPAIYAESGDIWRFTDSDPLVALAGVAPQRHESGQTAGQAKMSKRGAPYLRRAVWHAALTACRFDPMFQAIDDRQRKRGKPHLVALSHVANKLMRVIDAVLKGQRPYDPQAHVPATHC
jgi:transposase